MIKLKLLLENKYYEGDFKFLISPVGKFLTDDEEHIWIIQYDEPELYDIFLKSKYMKGYDEDNDNYGGDFNFPIDNFVDWMDNYLVKQKKWIRGGVWKDTFYLVMSKILTKKQEDILYDISLEVMKDEGHDFSVDITLDNKYRNDFKNIHEFILGYFK